MLFQYLCARSRPPCLPCEDIQAGVLQGDVAHGIRGLDRAQFGASCSRRTSAGGPQHYVTTFAGVVANELQEIFAGWIRARNTIAPHAGFLYWIVRSE